MSTVAELTTARDRWRALIVATAAFCIWLPGVFWGLPQGKFIVGALIILDGGVPYRDFWTMYAPGSFYAVAAIFALFGREVIWQGLAAILVQAGSAGVFFLLLRRVGVTLGSAFALVAVFVGMHWQTTPQLHSYAPALLLVLLGVMRLLRHGEDGNPVGSSGPDSSSGWQPASNTT